MSNVSAADREKGSVFMPRFDAQGLITAIAVDSATLEILMVAFMDAEALACPFPFALARSALAQG
jgi:phosphoribosyl-AMP cyclohydrolase